MSSIIAINLTTKHILVMFLCSLRVLAPWRMFKKLAYKHTT